MNNQPFQTAAKTYLDMIKTNGIKTTKKMRYIVFNFSGWLDDLIRRQNEKERMEHDKEN